MPKAIILECDFKQIDYPSFLIVSDLLSVHPVVDANEQNAAELGHGVQALFKRPSSAP